MDNKRHGRFGNGREPRVLWKNHADFIAILLHSGGGSEGKDRDSTGGVTPCRILLRGWTLAGAETDFEAKLVTQYLEHASLRAR